MVNERNGKCQRIAFSSARKKSTISCLSNTSSVATYGGPRYPFWSLCSIKPDGNDGAHADVGAAQHQWKHPGPGNSRPMWRLECFMVHGLARNASILKE